MSTTELPEWPLKEIRNHGEVEGIIWATAPCPFPPAVNGYVYLPEGHPWRGKDYDAIDAEVHGGLTYAGSNWIGFDFVHSGDYWPGQNMTRFSGDEVRTEADVEREAIGLALQAAAALREPEDEA